MKKTYVFLIFLASLSVFAQSYGDQLTMKVEAVVSTSPLSIELSWTMDANASEYTIYRKLKNASTWGTPIATLPGSITTFVDLAVEENTLYDYYLIMTPITGVTKRSYVNSGIEVKTNSNQGIAIVVVEQSHFTDTDFENAFDVFIEDIELSGWFPKIIYVNASDLVTSVKSEIVAVYNESPTNTSLLILLGNVPVPYSGNLNPDGHTDHQGAWPTDTYYADINGSWTDVSINNVTSANALNHNIPGDGKFDNSFIASDVELQVGRIDLSNLPAFSSSETELLTLYLQKNHKYKVGEIVVQEKALIDDNFAGMTEGFSQNGYNNFAPLVGRDQTFVIDYFTNLSYNTSGTGTYLWSYGCGAGSYTNCSGVGNTTAFSNDSLSTIFTMLFGSYFGDWNYTNALLRAPLAQGNTLTNCWAGRPNWHFIHMGMGENIGYSTRLSQNNSNLFFPSTLGTGVARIVSTNLMGDPSLKMTYIEMPSNLSITEMGNSKQLNWSASSLGPEIGYNIYRRYENSTVFEKLNDSLVTDLTFTDTTLAETGMVNYYVKAVEMKTTYSGSFQNESLGLKGQAISSVSIAENTKNQLKIYPNPAKNYFILEVDKNNLHQEWQIFDIYGKLITTGIIQNTEENIDISNLSKGIYFVKVGDENAMKLVVLE